MYKRIFIIVLDSVGAGFAPDQELYDDVGAHTILNISKHHKLTIPNLVKLGFPNITEIESVLKHPSPIGVATTMIEASNGKDTMTGHWEIMGLFIEKPFITFTETGFPKELIDELEKRTNRKVIGNCNASGTEIIKKLGERHLKTGELIVYTSADSVLQIAMHEDVIPLTEQYKIAKIARELTLKDEWKVGRVITRPFVGTNKDNFFRTSNRHDYALKPHDKTALNYLKDAGFDVISVGKIADIFDNDGITKSFRTVSNEDGMEKTINIAKNDDFTGICFVNLVDFDALYGHRRDPIGYGKALDRFDIQLGTLLPLIKEDDLLVLTADHGNDPTFKGTDHTREIVPLLMYNPKMKNLKIIERRRTFADIAATITENFKIKKTPYGTSFLKKLKGEK
ncbi:MAG: phosphopentomutase [Acholeplasmatales bacterium]